jgi:hypothetical protein
MALYDVVNVTGAVLVKFQMMTGTFLEYDDGHIDRAKNTELVRLLEEVVLAL